MEIKVSYFDVFHIFIRVLCKRLAEIIFRLRCAGMSGVERSQRESIPVHHALIKEGNSLILPLESTDALHQTPCHKTPKANTVSFNVSTLGCIFPLTNH